MSELATSLGKRLRFFRLQAGYTQEALAEKSGLHATYIGQLERGEKNATLESVAKVAKALNISLESLLSGLSEGRSNENFSTECMNLILSRSPKEQKELLAVLQSIIEYRDFS